MYIRFDVQRDELYTNSLSDKVLYMLNAVESWDQVLGVSADDCTCCNVAIFTAG